MKKLISVFTLVALVFSITLSAQEEPKQEKKAKSEKSCSTAEKKSCGKEKKAGCCASKKAAEEKKA
jgi:hypothetical protein